MVWILKALGQTLATHLPAHTLEEYAVWFIGSKSINVHPDKTPTFTVLKTNESISTREYEPAAAKPCGKQQSIRVEGQKETQPENVALLARNVNTPSAQTLS